MENAKKNERNMIILIALLVIVIVGLVGYIFCNRNMVFSKVEKEPKKSENTNKVIKELDLSKSLNTTGISYSKISTAENYGLSMKINEDKRSITLSIDWKTFCFPGTACGPTTEDYQIIGFSKNVKSTFVGTLGQDATGITLFYLMEDGSIEYTPMVVEKFDNQNASYYGLNSILDYETDGRVKGQHFITKKIENVSDVVTLYNVSASSTFGWNTTIGAKADGSFYDLGHIISHK